MLRQTIELYSRLLDYPNESFAHDFHLLEQNIRTHHNSLTVLEQLELFNNAVGELKLPELQETFTRTFDLSPVCSPHIGFHLFGESYKRGSLMAELKREYETYGLQEGLEIPDHISLMLKYLSVLAGREKEQDLFEELLTLCIFPGLEKMVAAFTNKTNPYGYLLKSLSIWLSEQGLPNKAEVNTNV